VTDEFLDAAQRSGFNRISIGAQSADDRLLKLLGRIHSSEDICKTVAKIRSHGFHNFNLDMMIGLPGQDLNDVTDTLQCFLTLKPTHISCYSLIVEEGTRMFDRVQSGEAVLPDEDLERAMYDTVRSTLEKAGYHQYEISNYALEGFECRHNLDCWNRKEYLGIGVAAAGFIGNRRTRNPASITDYCNKAEPEVIELSESDEMFESVMLGLRLTRGLSKTDFYERHHKDICQVYGAVIERLIGQELLTWDEEYLRCTKRGLDLQNMVLTEFLQ
jgi:oxygen-independent coproporphyrinogen-3 oxidase